MHRLTQRLTLGLTACLFAGLTWQNLAYASADESASDKRHNFVVDPVHSVTLFKIGYFDFNPFMGRFNEIDGSMVFDDAQPERSMLDIRINSESIDTANEARDRHLKSPDFFNAAKHPTISFKSTQFEESGDKSYKVTGDLTLLGVTKSITVDLQRFGTGPHQPSGTFRTGVMTTFTIKRSEFGMTTYVPALSDEVELTVSLQGVRR